MRIKDFSGITKQRNFISAELKKKKKSYIYLHCSKNNDSFSFLHINASQPNRDTVLRHEVRPGGAGAREGSVPSLLLTTPMGAKPPARKNALRYQFCPPPAWCRGCDAAPSAPAAARNPLPERGCRTRKITSSGHLLRECLFILKQKPTHKCSLYTCVPIKGGTEQLKKEKAAE